LKNTILRKGILSSVSLAIGLVLSNLSLIAVAEPPLPLRTGLPGRRFGSGVRCRCILNLPMVALIPENHVGETISANPTIHILTAPTDEFPQSEFHQGEFHFFDDNDTLVYTASQRLSPEGGIVSFRVPSDLLTLNDNYRWTFSILDDDMSHTAYGPVLMGWLRQVEFDAIAAEPISSIRSRSLESTLALLNDYQSAGLWTDAVTLIVNLRQQHPNESSVQAAWVQLLQTLDVTRDDRLFGEN